jgi:hypothetical protein
MYQRRHPTPARRRDASASADPEARDGFASAAKLYSGGAGVPAIAGGTMAQFADRLPEKHRAAAWAQAYDNYTLLWSRMEALKGAPQ